MTFFQFRHIGEFRKLLDDRELMGAIIHFGACLNPACRRANGKIQRWLTSSAEIPVAIIGHMESWRRKVEGPFPPRKGEQPGGQENT